MNGLLTIFRRELAGLFLLPVAWILFFLTLLYHAFWFTAFLRTEGGEVNQAMMLSLGSAWSFWILATVLPPLLTMRMISEETRSGMLEFLLTAPVGDAAVVCGKALAATTFMGLVWLAIPIYGLLVQGLGAPPDWGLVLSAWLGAVLVSGLFAAIGLAYSALCSTPILAAFFGIVTNMLLLFLPLLERFEFGQATLLSAVLSKLDVVAHLQGSFQTGAIDSAHLVFFLAWGSAVLFIATRLVERKRWM